MSDKEASNVITSENSGDFYAQKLGLADSTPVPAEEPSSELPVVEETQNLPDAEEETKPTEETEKPVPKLEKRWNKVVYEREQARKEAAKERELRESLEQRLQALETAKQPEKVEDPDREPQPGDFTDAFEYARELAKYAADNALKNRDKIEAERKQTEERQKLNEAWKSKVEAAKSELPDYEAMVASSDITVSDQVRDAILESDVGAKILYHLAENPEVAEKINGLSVVSALREIGRIEARFEKAPEVKPVVKKSNAPAPITPIRGGSNVDVPLTSDGEFTGTPAQWKELRRAGKIR
jgi:hypothetical protein